MLIIIINTRQTDTPSANSPTCGSVEDIPGTSLFQTDADRQPASQNRRLITQTIVSILKMDII